MQYVALLRGISPTNPNMRNEKLRGVFEKLGLKNVASVISSGNVIFDSNSKNIAKLEDDIEKALLQELSIKSPAFIRSKEQLERLIRKDPFKGKIHGRKTYLIASFLKKKPSEIFTVIDLTTSKTPDFMTQTDKKFNKAVTTRTWKTVERIFSKMK